MASQRKVDLRDLDERVAELAIAEERPFTNMVRILVREAIEARETLAKNGEDEPRPAA